MINGVIEDVFPFTIRGRCSCGDRRCRAFGEVQGRGIRLRVRPWDREDSGTLDLAPTNYQLVAGDWVLTHEGAAYLHQRIGPDEYAQPVRLALLPLDPKTLQPRPYTVPEL